MLRIALQRLAGPTLRKPARYPHYTPCQAMSSQAELDLGKHLIK